MGQNALMCVNTAPPPKAQQVVSFAWLVLESQLVGASIRSEAPTGAGRTLGDGPR